MQLTAAERQAHIDVQQKNPQQATAAEEELKAAAEELCVVSNELHCYVPQLKCAFSQP